MIKRIYPEKMLNVFSDVTPDLLREYEISTLLVDIDNTLAPYEEPEPSEAVRQWVDHIKASGIRIVLISNNCEPRVNRFNQSLGLPAVFDSGKPGTGKIKKFLTDKGIPQTGLGCLGDQLLTDAWLAHKLGGAALIVPPISDKSTALFRFKRRVERRTILAYMEHHEEYSYPFEKAAGSPEWKQKRGMTHGHVSG